MSYKNTRDIVVKLGNSWIKRASELHGCQGTRDYIENKYSRGSGFARIKKQ